MINFRHSTTNNAESSQWFGWVSIWTESKLKASLYVMCVISKWPENTAVKSLFCFLHNRPPSISKYFSHNFQWEPIRIIFVSIVFQQRVVFLCYKTLNSFPRTFRLKAFCINFSFVQQHLFFHFLILANLFCYLVSSFFFLPKLTDHYKKSAFSDMKKNCSFQEERETALF